MKKIDTSEKELLDKLNKISKEVNSLNIETENINPTKKNDTFNPQKSINSMNNLLESYEKTLDVYGTESEMQIIKGSQICEEILKFVLNTENYPVTDTNNFFEMINICIKNNIIPKSYGSFLHSIRRYRNEIAHSGLKTSKEMSLSFLKSFYYFMEWIDSYFSYNCHDLPKIKARQCCSKIDSILNKYISENEILDYTENYKPIQKTNYNNIIKELKKELSSKDKIIEKTQNENRILKEELIKKDEEYQKNTKIYIEKFEKFSDYFDESIKIATDTNEKITRVEKKVDDIAEKLNNISVQISKTQYNTEKLLEKAKSSFEMEEIMQTFTNNCIEHIMEYTQEIKTQNYELEEKKLIYYLGESAWNKLSEKSKTFLTTSRVMYNHLFKEDIIDYSGVCILVTKALEVEMKKRFYYNFLKYLDEKYNKDYSEYPSALTFKQKTQFKEYKFNLGSIAYVLCLKESKYDTNYQKINNESKLIEYCKTCIFSKYEDKEIKSLLNKYASSIEDIRINYRNPSAHTNEIQRVNAEECFNLVIYTERLLKQMLDSFDI